MDNKDKDEQEKGKEKRKGSIGCFVVMFLVIASGIPMAVKHEGEGSVGVIFIVIFGLAVAWYVAKAMSGFD